MYRMLVIAAFAIGGCTAMPTSAPSSRPQVTATAEAVAVTETPTEEPTGAAPAGTASPQPSASINAAYPDGLPMTVNGERAWRPADLLAASPLPRGEILVTAWDFGGLAHSCPAQGPGDSAFWCPDFEGLAEVRGGPPVLTLAWQHVPIQRAAALVVRVTVEPETPCVSIPPGGCPNPTLIAIAVIWAGAPE